jgi:hypothetical protein
MKKFKVSKNSSGLSILMEGIIENLLNSCSRSEGMLAPIGILTIYCLLQGLRDRGNRGC